MWNLRATTFKELSAHCIAKSNFRELNPGCLSGFTLFYYIHLHVFCCLFADGVCRAPWTREPSLEGKLLWGQQCGCRRLLLQEDFLTVYLHVPLPMYRDRTGQTQQVLTSQWWWHLCFNGTSSLSVSTVFRTSACHHLKTCCLPTEERRNHLKHIRS